MAWPICAILVWFYQWNKPKKCENVFSKYSDLLLCPYARVTSWKSVRQPDLVQVSPLWNVSQGWLCNIRPSSSNITQPSAVSPQDTRQCTLHCTLHCALYTVHYTVHSTLHTTLCTLHCTLHWHSTLYTQQCSVHCTLHWHSTMYSTLHTTLTLYTVH